MGGLDPLYRWLNHDQRAADRRSSSTRAEPSVRPTLTDEAAWVAATVQTVTLKVEMMCEGCAGAVRRILQKVEGASRSL